MSITEMEKQQAPPEPMLEFKFPPVANGQVDARTLVRWCTHKPLIEALVRNHFRDPRLLIVVRGPRELRDGSYLDTQWEDTAVYCVPLTAEMHYVYFHRPGINEIRAVVVDYANRSTRKWVRRQQEIPRERLSGLHPGYFPSLFIEGGSFSAHSNGRVDYFVTDVVEKVEVPAMLFAGEPTAWKKKLTSIYYKGRPYDECDFRSQVIGSFVRAAFYSTFGMLCRLSLLLLGMVLGLRRIHVFALLTPWRPHPQQILRDDTSVWFMNDRGFFRLSPLNLINPIMLSVAPALAFGIASIHHGKSSHRTKVWDISWWHCVAWIDSVITGVVVAVMLIIGIVLLAGSLVAIASNSRYLKNSRAVKFVNARSTAFTAYLKERGNERYMTRQQREKEHQLNIQARVAAMTCRLETSDVSIAALPKEKQTVKLKASQLKLRLCKPYAR